MPKSYPIHVCNSANDCSGTNAYCCNFGLSQVAWCSTFAESAYATNCY
jgi:hypothetical protein